MHQLKKEVKNHVLAKTNLFMVIIHEDMKPKLRIEF